MMVMARSAAAKALCIAILACIKHNRVRAFVASPPSPTASPDCAPSLKNRPSLAAWHRTLSQKPSSILHGPHRREHRRGAPFLAAPSSVQSASNDPRVESRTTHTVTVDLPLGLVIEEMDLFDPSFGVAIIGINEGNSARHNSDVFAEMKSRGGAMDGRSGGCICIRDKIMAVNGTPCADKGFDDVISLIAGTQSDKVTLALGRLSGSTVVNYYDGICISAKAGESYGFLAEKCGVCIDYECRTGNCQTCASLLEFPDKDRDLSSGGGGGSLYERTIFHCVGKVPRGYQWLHVLGPRQRENVVKLHA